MLSQMMNPAITNEDMKRSVSCYSEVYCNQSGGGGWKSLVARAAVEGFFAFCDGKAIAIL